MKELLKTYFENLQNIEANTDKMCIESFFSLFK